jgi:hypothetical protein
VLSFRQRNGVGQCEDGRQDHEYSVMVIAEAASVGVSECTPLRWKNIDN